MFYYTPSMVLCVTLLHAVYGIMHCPTFCVNHREVVNADIVRSNYLSIQVVPLVEMTVKSVASRYENFLRAIGCCNQHKAFGKFTDDP